MTLGSVTSTNLRNSLTGYGGMMYDYPEFGFYGPGCMSPKKSKKIISNNYDMWQYQNGFNNKPAAEVMSINNQCQDIGSLLAKRHTDEASKEIEKLVKNLKKYPQYSAYSDKEVRAVMRTFYQKATGSDLITDINENASGSFVQGLKEGCILGGIFANRTTKADLESQVKGMKKDRNDKWAEISGSVLSGAATYGLIGLLGGPEVAAVTAIAGGVIGLVKAIVPSTIKSK